MIHICGVPLTEETEFLFANPALLSFLQHFLDLLGVSASAALEPKQESMSSPAPGKQDKAEEFAAE